MADDSTPKELVTLRVPHAIAMEVRRMAAHESESQSTILRRIIRLGLSALQREQVAAQ